MNRPDDVAHAAKLAQHPDRACAKESMSNCQFIWRGEFENASVNALHAEAFDHPVLNDDWSRQVREHSLGWCAPAKGTNLSDS